MKRGRRRGGIVDEGGKERWGGETVQKGNGRNCLGAR